MGISPACRWLKSLTVLPFRTSKLPVSPLPFYENRRPSPLRRAFPALAAGLLFLAASTGLSPAGDGTVPPADSGAAGSGTLALLPSSGNSEAKVSDRRQGGGLRMRLVSNVSAVQPGQTFYLGLWIQHDPGYHTYWSNPGIAGVATQLKPELPPGFTAGPLVYPPPDKVKMSILNVHGYERDVMVALPVTAPQELAGASATFPVRATWMCCRTTCNPGFANLSLTLPLATPADGSAPASAGSTEWKPLFDALLASQPPAATGWTFTARKNSGITPETIALTATPPAGVPAPEKPQFFSSDNLVCSHPDQHWKSGPGGTLTATLTLSDFPPKDQTHLRGLLHNTGTASLLPGVTASYVTVDVPVQQEAQVQAEKK